MENSLILNREFGLPADGFYQIAPIGEFENKAAGVVQVIDRAACDAMVARFAEDAKATNFGGVLVDFDHGSLDTTKSSEAAGWIVELQCRTRNDERRIGSKEIFTTNGEKNTKESEDDSRKSAESAKNTGLWANIRWSDVGELAVKGGRYRYVSPVWARSDCEDLGPSTGSGQCVRRVRPLRLLNLAVTNDPNLKGMVPLSNRGQKGRNDERGTMNDEADGMRNAAQAGAETTTVEKLFKWTLVANDRHCPSCASLPGQVHTADEWKAAGLIPGGGGTYCGGNCHYALVETSDPATGDLGKVDVKQVAVNNQAAKVGMREVKGISAMTNRELASYWKMLRAKENGGTPLDAQEKAFMGNSVREAVRRAIEQRRKGTMGGSAR